jgi:hypothetical protein
MITYSKRIFLPIEGKLVTIRPLTNKEYFIYLKYAENDDDLLISGCLESLLSECTNNHSFICNIDKFIALLEIRSLSLGDELRLRVHNVEISFKTKVIIKNVIDNIAPNVLECLPYNLYHSSDDELLAYCSLRRASLSVDTINISKLTVDEVLNWYERQKASTVNETKDNILHINELFMGKWIINPNDKIKLEGIPLHPTDNTMYQFLKVIFSEKLSTMYEMEYAFSTKLNMGYDRFSQLTPNESQIFTKLYKTEKEAEAEAQKRAK